MANISLAGQIAVELNHTFGVTIYDFSINGDRPATAKVGAQGMIGLAQGVEKPTASFKLAVPVTGLEFDVVALMANPLGFSVSFPIGAERHILYGAKVTKRGVTNNAETGDTVFSIEVAGTEWNRLS